MFGREAVLHGIIIPHFFDILLSIVHIQILYDMFLPSITPKNLYNFFLVILLAIFSSGNFRGISFLTEIL